MGSQDGPAVICRVMCWDGSEAGILDHVSLIGLGADVLLGLVCEGPDIIID